MQDCHCRESCSCGTRIHNSNIMKLVECALKVHLTPKYICSSNKCLCYVKKVGAIFFFDLNNSSIFYVLLKSRNIWLKSAFIRDLRRVEL